MANWAYKVLSRERTWSFAEDTTDEAATPSATVSEEWEDDGQTVAISEGTLHTYLSTLGLAGWELVGTAIDAGTNSAGGFRDALFVFKRQAS